MRLYLKPKTQFLNVDGVVENFNGNSPELEPEGSTLQIPKPAFGLSPELVLSIFILITYAPILKLSSHLVSLTNGHFPRGFPTKILYSIFAFPS
jgi:hypothetical protein